MHINVVSKCQPLTIKHSYTARIQVTAQLRHIKSPLKIRVNNNLNISTFFHDSRKFNCFMPLKYQLAKGRNRLHLVELFLLWLSIVQLQLLVLSMFVHFQVHFTKQSISAFGLFQNIQSYVHQYKKLTQNLMENLLVGIKSSQCID